MKRQKAKYLLLSKISKYRNLNKPMAFMMRGLIGVQVGHNILKEMEREKLIKIQKYDNFKKCIITPKGDEWLQKEQTLLF